MAECMTTKMDKAELEELLQRRYGNKIEPVKECSGQVKCMRGYYEQVTRPHNIVHRMKDGRLKIKYPDGHESFMDCFGFNLRN